MIGMIARKGINFRYKKAMAFPPPPYFSYIKDKERRFCVLLRCDSRFAWRGVIEPGKTSHLFYRIGISRHFQCEERWFCVLPRCKSSLSWRGFIEPGKTLHLFYRIRKLRHSVALCQPRNPKNFSSFGLSCKGMRQYPKDILRSLFLH